jgi:prepilin-type N-terminal cleavage/methylation domain-containing protein
MNIRNQYAGKSKRSGFSLIELIVSVGIFSITATFAIGTLLTLTNAQRKAAALQSAFDNVRFAIESMSKDMRTGTNYACIPANDYPCTHFSYTNTIGEVIEYQLGSNQIQKNIASFGFQDVTDSSIYIKQLDFYLKNAALGDQLQPTVTIVVDGISGRSRAGVESKIQLQSTITPRKLQP